MRNIGRLLAVSTLLLTSPRATESQVSARAVRVRKPSSQPVAGSRAGPQAEQHRDDQQGGHAEQRLDDAAERRGR